MRFYSPSSRLKSWHCTIFFRDLSQPLTGRVGETLFKLGGKGTQEVKHVQFECRQEHHSVELYPPGRVLAVIVSPEAGIDPGFVDSLELRDEVELSDPRRHRLITPAQAHDLGLSR